MRKLIIGSLVLALLALCAVAVAAQQPAQPAQPPQQPVQPPQQPVQQPTTTVTTTQVTKTTQNPDGTYTIIEYPVGKEVTLMLDPIALKAAKGRATILRDPTGTTIKLNLAGLPADAPAINIYAVDSTGATTLLGPVVVTNGEGVLTATTPLNQFMLIASPEASLATYGPDTKIVYRSAVPEGYAVVPFSGHPVGEKVAATTTTGPVQASTYTVPMLNIPAFKKGDDTKMKINFSGPLAGARANVFIEPHKDGKTDVRFRFHELKEAPTGKVYTVWAVSPDNQFVKIGQIVNTKGHNEAEVQSQVPLPDFGLLVTMEDAGELAAPSGIRVGSVEIIRTN